ncbi:MAG: MFS transporter [Mycobacteriales bacterium]
MERSTFPRRPTLSPLALGLLVGLVAANLRPLLASVGPMLPDLRADLALSGTAVAVMAGLGVLCLGLLAPVAPRPARRWGINRVLTGSLVALVVGLLVRATGGAVALFAGTVLACAGVAVANVLLPAVIKRDFPSHPGPAMGVYTMALSGSAAVAAASTAPLAALLGLGWRGGLGVWAVPATVALAAWVFGTRGGGNVPIQPPPRGSVLRDALAWQVTAFFGLVGLGFHALLVWLPSIYRAQGLGAQEAGLLLSVLVLVQAPVALVVPRFAVRARNQQRQVVLATALTGIGLAGLLLAPLVAPYLWVLVLGLGQGANFSLSLTMFVLRTRSSGDTARVSALAQTVGYLIAALGPLLLGALNDITGSWTPALLLLLAVLVPQLAAGLFAGRDRHVQTS